MRLEKTEGGRKVKQAHVSVRATRVVVDVDVDGGSGGGGGVVW